jgi:hypothetical protein
MTDGEMEKLLQNRAPLFAPEPEGNFASYRESLVSYFREVCAVNLLPTTRVVDQLFKPHLNGYSKTNHTYYPVYAVNYGGQITKDFASILENLTGTSQLKRLTFDAWNSHDPSRPLIAIEETKKWCPACFQAMACEERRLHDPLFWSVKGVEICPLHSIFLERRCPHCGKKSFPMLISTDVAGFCPSCHGWLGSNGREIVKNSDETFKYYDWVANAYFASS